MNKSFYNQENIEAYLTNRLSGQEKLQFENGLEKDPLIQNEVNLQKEIIESLKQSRRLELKNRLNNIEVGTGVSYTFRYAAAASVLLLGLFSGSYLYFNTEKPLESPVISQKITGQKPMVEQKIPVITLNRENAKVILPLLNPEEKSPVLAPGKPKNSNLPVVEDNQIYAEVKSPEVKEGFADDDIRTENNVVVPEGNVISNEDNYKSDVELSIQPNGENSFHYQYYSNKLYLFCDFKSKPYELLEWNTKNTKQLYLYFNNTYYELKNNQTEISPLTPIKDKQLIKQLNGIKDK